MEGGELVTDTLKIDREKRMKFFKFTGAEAADHCDVSPDECVEELAVRVKSSLFERSLAAKK